MHHSIQPQNPSYLPTLAWPSSLEIELTPTPLAICEARTQMGPSMIEKQSLVQQLSLSPAALGASINAAP